MVGESLITLDENESPYETFTTSFQVLPSVNTPQGLYVTPSSQVEDAESSRRRSRSFRPSSATRPSSTCGSAPANSTTAANEATKLIIVRAEPRGRHQGPALNSTASFDAIELDNNGNGFALLLGSDSCAEGTSLIEGDLERAPFTTETGTFTVEAPRVRFGD